MSGPDYEALRAASVKRRGSNLSPKARAKRAKEAQSRSATAQGRARAAIATLYPEDWASLYQQALAEVNAERGPLPGDEQ